MGVGTPEELALPVAARVRALLPAGTPVVVGLDGRSGSGKSTMALAVASLLAEDGTSTVVVEGDDFYAGGSARTWDRRSPSERAAQVIDWRRQRPVLAALRSGEAASWRPFDWEDDRWDGDELPLGEAPVEVRPADVVVLEGAYSCRPELHDLLDLRVLLDVPPEVRRAQLLGREGDGFRTAWEVRWSSAEDHYFSLTMPPASFDLIVGPAPGA